MENPRFGGLKITGSALSCPEAEVSGMFGETARLELYADGMVLLQRGSSRRLQAGLKAVVQRSNPASPKYGVRVCHQYFRPHVGNVLGSARNVVDALPNSFPFESY